MNSSTAVLSGHSCNDEWCMHAFRSRIEELSTRTCFQSIVIIHFISPCDVIGKRAIIIILPARNTGTVCLNISWKSVHLFASV